MSKIKRSKLGRVLCLALTICLMLSMLAPGMAMANSADVKTALSQMNSLSNADKSLIMQHMWDYAISKIGDGEEVTVEEIRNRILDELEEAERNIIVDVSTPGDGKLATESLDAMIQELLDSKEMIVNYYNYHKQYITKPYVKELLGLNASASEGAVYAKLLDYEVKVVELNSSKTEFKRYGDVSTRIASKLGFTKEALELVFGDINGNVDQFISKINDSLEEKGVSATDLVDALKIYGLYYEPSTNNDDDNGSNNNSGGSNPVVTSAPTASPTPAAPDAAKIDEIKDPTEAKNTAIQMIKGADSAGEKELSDKLQEVADKVMEKVNTEKVQAVVEQAKAKITVDQAAVSNLLNKMDTIVNTAKELNTELASKNVDARAEAVLNLKVETAADVKEVEAALPTTLLTAALEKKIDKIAIETGVATIAIAPDAIDAADAATVTLSAKKLDTAELSDAVKAKIGDAPVFDFNAAAGDKKVTKFKKPVEISVPYTLKAGENAKKITVFFINDNGELENVIGNYDEKTGKVKFTTSHFSKYVVKVNEVSFSDISSAAWAKEYVEVMAAKGMVNGMGDGSFAPNTNITRAQFAAMVVRAFKLSDTEGSVKFTDVNESDWFSKEVAAASNAGLIEGRGNGTFAPNENITRQDMAVIMTRALAKCKNKNTSTAGSYVDKFADKSEISAYAKDSVATGVKFALIEGMSSDTFAPKALATRAQAATIMYRLFYVK